MGHLQREETRARMSVFSLASILPERRAFNTFETTHPDIPLGYGYIFDPQSINRDALVAEGFITAENLYDQGALARALANVAIWHRCRDSGMVVHIANDGAVLRSDFVSAIAPHIEDPHAFDIIMWCHDFSGPIRLNYAPGVEGLLLYDQSNQAPEIDAFQNDSAPVQRFRLLQSTGCFGYTVSPGGAAKLLTRCLPFGTVPLVYPGAPALSFLNTGFEIEMARHYPDLAAFVLQPVLGLMPSAASSEGIGFFFKYAFKTLALPHAQPRCGH